MKKITLSILLLLSMLSFGQSATVTVTNLKVRNIDASTINFGTNVTSVNVSITASVSSSYNTAQGSIMVYYKRNSSTSTAPVILTNGYDGNFFLPNGFTGTKTFTITLSRSEFDNTGGVVYVEYHPSTSSILAYKSTNINVTKLVEPISNNIISGNQTINEGQMPSIISGTLPEGGNGTYTYEWQLKIGNDWATLWEYNSGSYSPPYKFSVETSTYRRIVKSVGAINSISNEITVTVIPAPPLQNNTITLTGNTILGSEVMGGTGTYQYWWVAHGGEELIVIPNANKQNLEIPSWIHNELYESINTTFGLYMTRYVNSGRQTVTSTVRVPLLNSNRMSSNEVTIQSDLPEEELMTVYPNPTSESVNFSTNFSTDKQIEIVVYSEKSGNEKSVFKGTVNPSQVVNWKIPSSYQKGLYFYKILSDNKEVKTGKIIFK